MVAGFLWPALLWGMLLLPLLAVLYFRMVRRPPARPLPFPDGATLAAAAGQGRRFIRYLPAILFAVALGAALAALARPVALVPVPADRSAIILSMDASGSMRSQDIAPSRMEAAKAAAKTFLATLPPRVRVGLVAFGGYAFLLVPPSTERERLEQSIDGLSFIRRTAIGEGLLEAVVALPGRVRPGPDGTPPPPPSASLTPGVIILLSDGVSNTGIDPLQAAQIARSQQVTVFTVGVGQPSYTGAWTVGGPLDDETLKEIADITGGRYFHASSAEGLQDVYRNLARTVGWEHRREEVTSVAAAFSALALVSAFAVARVAVYRTAV